MAWMDFEKFQTRSGNEPRAAALERKVANEWMGAGFDSPSVTPYWQKGFTTEHPGVSPGGGNARTYQEPSKFGTSVAPEFGNPKFDFNVEDLPIAGPEEEEETYSQRANRQWKAQENYNKAQMLMNEPGARRTERELAEEFDNGFSSFTPHLQQGFEPGQGGKFGWPGNWPGTPIGLGMEPRWNWSIEPNFAEGGIASINQRNRPKMFIGGLLGIGALLGLGKMLGGRKRRGEVKSAIKDRPWGGKIRPPIRVPSEDDEDFQIGGPIAFLNGGTPPLFNRADGGAVGNRPGYWGGGALSALGKRLSDRKASDFAGGPVDMPNQTFNKPSWGEMANTYSKYNKDWSNPVSDFMKEHGRSILFANPISNAMGRWNRSSEMGRLPSYKFTDPGMGIETDQIFSDPGMGIETDQIFSDPGMGIETDQIFSDPGMGENTGMTDDEIEEWYRKQDYNDGGAVGLEPGIGSLMGRI